MAIRRAWWRVWQRLMDSTALVFLDETATATDMTTRHGWGPRDRRLVGKAPAGHRCTTTLVAGLRSTGIVAPLVISGALSGEDFLAYLRHSLAPSLSPGDVVVMDNLPAHKVAGVEQAIEAAGASVLYLPPYSPDLNPIEQVFAKIKTLLRKAEPRTKDTLWRTIGTLLTAIGPQECQNYITNSGYVLAN